MYRYIHNTYLVTYIRRVAPVYYTRSFLSVSLSLVTRLETQWSVCARFL